MADFFDVDAAIKRLKRAFSLKTDRELSDLFGISRQDFSARKKRETLGKHILSWAAERKISAKWLTTGLGSPSDSSAPGPKPDTQPGIMTTSLDEEMLLAWYRDCTPHRQSQRDILNSAKLAAEMVKKRFG